MGVRVGVGLDLGSNSSMRLMRRAAIKGLKG